MYLPSKHSSWWRRLEDVMKTSFVFVFKRRLEDVFKTSWWRWIYSYLSYVFKTSCKNVFKTSSRHLQNFFPRRLQDVIKSFSRRLANTSWRHLQDVLKTYHQVKLFLLTILWEVFNVSVKCTAKTVVYTRIHLGHTSEKFMVIAENLQGQ